MAPINDDPLDAEAEGYGQKDDELCCATYGRTLMVHGLECPTLSAPKPTGPPPPRFGNRLRTRDLLWQMKGVGATVGGIADDIDQDANDLRRQIREAVEELRHSVLVVGAGLPSTRAFDAIKADVFLERIAGIFGPRETPPPAPTREVSPLELLERKVRDLAATGKMAQQRLDGHHRAIYDALAPQIGSLERRIKKLSEEIAAAEKALGERMDTLGGAPLMPAFTGRNWQALDWLLVSGMVIAATTWVGFLVWLAWRLVA